MVRVASVLAMRLLACAGLLIAAHSVSTPAAGEDAGKQSAVSEGSASMFVTRQGTQFVLNGQPFPVVGVNNHYLPFGSEQEVIRVLDDAVAMGANVVRTFIQPVIGSRDGTTKPTIWDWKSKAEASNLGVNRTYMLYWDTTTSQMAFNDGPDGLQRMDFLIHEARKRNLKLIIAFLDFWSYTGGAQQMRAWYGSEDKHTFFAKDPRTQRDFKDWIAHVIMRVNARDGLRYRDDPTIFAWELMNEPEITPALLLQNWVMEMSRHVKSLDGNHLLATGHGYIYAKFNDLAIDTIDFGTWHGYPIHMGISPGQMDGLIDDLCALAKKSSKPMLLSEFGFARSNPGYVHTYEKWLDTIYRNPDCAGWLVWRLVSRQDHGSYPQDTHDQFDVHNDGGPLWLTLKAAGTLLMQRRSVR